MPRLWPHERSKAQRNPLPPRNTLPAIYDAHSGYPRLHISALVQFAHALHPPSKHPLPSAPKYLNNLPPNMPPKPKLNVHSFPRPPLCEKTPRHLQIKWRNQIIADTKDAYWVLETTHPPSILALPPFQPFGNG